MRTEIFKQIFPLAGEREFVRGPMIAADHLAILLNQPLDKVCQNGSLLAEGLLNARSYYNSDFIIVFSDIAVEAEALGVKLEFSEKRNPHVISQVNPGDVKIIDMPKAGRIPELFKAARICRQELEEEMPVFFSIKDPFSLAALVMGSEDFLRSLLEAPDIARNLIEICCRNQLILIDAICSEGFIPMVGAPIASGSLIGATWFRNFVQQYLARLFDRAQANGSFRCMHICGEVGLLAEPLSELNPDILSFEEWFPAMWERLPNTIPMGYVPTDLFAKGTEDSVRRASLDCIKSLPQPFILSTACDIPANSESSLVGVMMNAN